MYCQKCGRELPKEARFCHHCGTRLSASAKEAASAEKCSSCGAPLKQTEKGLVCPYCGNFHEKKDSEAVQLEKLRIEAVREQREALKKEQDEREERRRAQQRAERAAWDLRREKAAYKKEKARIFAIIVTVFAALLLIVRQDVLLILQLVLFILYFLAGNQVIRFKQSWVRKLFVYIGFFLIMPICARF